MQRPADGNREGAGQTPRESRQTAAATQRPHRNEVINYVNEQNNLIYFSIHIDFRQSFCFLILSLRKKKLLNKNFKEN